MKKLLFTLIAGLSLALTGCHRATIENLEGTWNTTSLIEQGNSVEVVISQINFEKTEAPKYKVSGNSGVNQFSGTVTLANGKFTAYEDFASTKMMGAPEAQTFEDFFLMCIMNGDSYEISADKLSIQNKKAGITLTFSRAN